MYCIKINNSKSIDLPLSSLRVILFKKTKKKFHKTSRIELTVGFFFCLTRKFYLHFVIVTGVDVCSFVEKFLTNVEIPAVSSVKKAGLPRLKNTITTTLLIYTQCHPKNL